MNINPERIASAIIGTSILGFLGVSWSLGQYELSNQVSQGLTILRHGFEGALVGGICDFIAVKSVYSAARDHFPSLRDNTTRIVIQDMVQVKKQIEDLSNLEGLLSEPNRQQQFATAVEEFVPSKDHIATFVSNLWEAQLRPHLARWLINYRFQGTAKQFTTRHKINTDLFRKGAVELLRDVANQESDNKQLVEKLRQLASDVTLHDVGVPSEPAAVRHLLEKLYTHWSSLDPNADVSEKSFFARIGHNLVTQAIVGFSPAIAHKVKSTSLEDTFDPLLTEETLKSTLLAIAEKVETPPVETTTEQHDLLADIVSYWLVFVRAWEDLDPQLRIDIVNEAIRIVETPALDLVTDRLWELRMELLNPQNLLAQDGTQQIIETVSSALKDKAEDIEQTSIRLLQEQFDSMGEDNFVEMIRRNTKTRLDWIKVNGSGWGFVLGAGVGLIGMLLGH